jgi:hypothetical protein
LFVIFLSYVVGNFYEYAVYQFYLGYPVFGLAAVAEAQNLLLIPNTFSA